MLAIARRRLVINQTFSAIHRCSIAPLPALAKPRWSTSAATAPAFPPRIEPYSPAPLTPDDGTPNDASPTSSGVQLRDYQTEAISACLTALQNGLSRIGVSSPTGSGKTTMFMHLIPAVCDARPPSADLPEGKARGRALVLVSGAELARQTELAAVRMLGAGWSVEVEQGVRRASGTADVTVATYQTLNNVDRLRKFNPRMFDLVIVDEAHHAAALSYLRLLHYFNDAVELPAVLSPITTHRHGTRVPIVGFSATFSRPDQLALRAAFEKIVFHREITAMLEEGWLSPAKFTAVRCNLDLQDVDMTMNGDYASAALAARLNTQEINDLVVRTYLHKAASRRSTLIFCVDLAHVAAVTQTFRNAGIDGRSVSSESHPATRRQTLAGFLGGEFPVLVNCQVLTEAADIPCIDCVILARPTKSRNLLAQMVGRGLRLSPETGKTDCHIIDIVDTVGRADGMIVSPTLWGLTHDEAAERERAEDRNEREEDDVSSPVSEDTVAPEGPRGMRVTFVDRDDPFQLHGSQFTPLAKLSVNAWVACGRGRYILDMFSYGEVIIESNRTDGLTSDPEADEKDALDDTLAAWSISHRPRMVPELGRLNLPARRAALAPDMERAFQTADQLAAKRTSRVLYTSLSRYAPWRQRAPSERAMASVARMKRGGEVDEAGKLVALDVAGRRVPVGKLTAGHVAAFLTAATHGAVAARRKIESAEQTEARRVARKADKARALAERNLPLPMS